MQPPTDRTSIRAYFDYRNLGILGAAHCDLSHLPCDGWQHSHLIVGQGRILIKNIARIRSVWYGIQRFLLWGIGGGIVQKDKIGQGTNGTGEQYQQQEYP